MRTRLVGPRGDATTVAAAVARVRPTKGEREGCRRLLPCHFVVAGGRLSTVRADEPGDYWEIAAKVCTPKQLNILELHERDGLSLRSTALACGLSVSTVRGQLDAAHLRVAKALEPAERTGSAVVDAAR
jgi:hypothetical protein